MKKVLLVANLGFTISNFRSELIQKFINNGYCVKVVCPKKGDFNNKLESLGVDIIEASVSRRGLNPIRDFVTFYEFYKIFKQEKPDIVINYTIKPVIYSSMAAFFSKVPKVASFITGLGYIFTKKSIKTQFIKYIVLLLYRLAISCNYKVFFQNKDDLQVFLDAHVIPRRKVAIINGSGVNLSKFVIEENVEKINNSFVFVGRLLKDKGVGEFIDAARLIKKKYPDVSFWLCGCPDNDNPASFSKQDIEAWINEGVIHYLNYTDNVNLFLEDKKVFILPSYREGTPRAVLEAMAMKMPIITTDAPGCRETTKDNYNGFLVDVGDAQQIADAIEKFILEPKLIKTMGENSYKIVRNKYNVNSVNTSIWEGLGLY